LSEDYYIRKEIILQRAKVLDLLQLCCLFLIHNICEQVTNTKPIKTPMGTNGHLDLDTGGKSVDQKVIPVDDRFFTLFMCFTTGYYAFCMHVCTILGKS
jgi:hypothetical protein